MVAVLQILLKILGIILLSLIGLLIVLLLIVLFVPVRYRLKGYYKDEFVCHGKVTWLLHLVSVSVDYEKELVTKIRILGIPLEVFKKKSSNREKAISEPEEKKLPDKTGNTVISEAASVSETNSDANATNDKMDNFNAAIADEKNTSAEENIESDEKLSWFQKIKQKILSFIQKLHDIFDKVRSVIQNIRQKKETIEHYIEIIKRDEVKQAFSVCKRRIWLLIKHILPKKMKVNAVYGFDDPSTTGYVLAVYGMLPSAIGKKIILHPDFENSLFTCDFYMKGSVNAWSLLHQLLCILTDKNCRALYHIVKKEILNERK